MSQLYVIALGSNRRHHIYGAPKAVLKTAYQALSKNPIKLIDTSPIIQSEPLGPSNRRYANAAALIEARLHPPALLDHLKEIEQQFGKRRGQRWGSRVLDLDIILWSGGAFANSSLIIPHIHYRDRTFVLSPINAIVPNWHDPMTGLKPAHLIARLQAAKPAL